MIILSGPTMTQASCDEALWLSFPWMCREGRQLRIHLAHACPACATRTGARLSAWAAVSNLMPLCLRHCCAPLYDGTATPQVRLPQALDGKHTNSNLCYHCLCGCRMLSLAICHTRDRSRKYSPSAVRRRPPSAFQAATPPCPTIPLLPHESTVPGAFAAPVPHSQNHPTAH